MSDHDETWVRTMRRKRTTRAAALGLSAALLCLVPVVGSGSAAAALPQTGVRCAASVSTAVSQPTQAQMAASGLGRLPVRPTERRVDLIAPPFANPTTITNPLFPISTLGSVVLNGRVDGKPFRTETTLLPETRVIEWSPGQCVKTLVSQYMAYLDGRLQEVALDFYAQADDGSVWYFGEDVYNYERGIVADTSGTWLAGKEGPAAMIMPAAPKVGQVHRPENIPGLVWEEVSVKETARTVRGPRGPLAGVMVGRELHDDGSFSDKLFAPGYGEFYSAHEGDVEALALAVPYDAKPGPLPRTLRQLTQGSQRASTAAGAGHWTQAAAAKRALHRAWKAHRAGDAPPRLVSPATRALARLSRALRARERRAAHEAALDLRLAAFDLRLQYQPIAEIDRARFDLWAQRARLDASTGGLASLRGDVATLEWIRDRIAHTLDPVGLTRLDTQLEALRANVTDRDVKAAGRTAAALRTTLTDAP